MSPNVFFAMAIAGIVSGLVFEIGKFVKTIFGNRIVATIVVDFATGIAVGIVFFLAEYLFLDFQIFVYGVISFVLGIILERMTIGFLLAKMFLMIYNWLAKAKHTKFGSKIFKCILK